MPPKLLAHYFYLWELAAVRQAIETAWISASVRRTFVEVLVPANSVFARSGANKVMEVTAVAFSNIGRRGVMRGCGRFAAPFRLGKIVSRPLLKLDRCEFLHGK